MGKKRGFHVVGVRVEVNWLGYYAVRFKRSKCRYAQSQYVYVWAKDELDAYMKVKQLHQGANQ